MTEALAPRRFLHVMGRAPLMLVQEVPPTFNLAAWCVQVRADQFFFDGNGVFMPYHAIQCVMLTTGDAPSKMQGYESDGNVVQFPPRPN